MGLRLYQAPVESDIQSKPAAEKTSAQARSSIRRTPRPAAYVTRIARIPEQAARDRRRRILAASAHAAATEATSSHAASYGSDRPARSRAWSPPPDEGAGSPANGDTSADAAPDSGRRALRNMASRMGILDDHIVAMFGERWAHLHAEANPIPLRDDDDDGPSPLSAMAVDPEFLPPRRRNLPSEAYATSSMRSTQAPGHPSRTSRPTGGYRRVDPEDEFGPIPSRRERINQLRRAVEAGTSFDGLGDRNRSLSPEGDHVWDTLLTTISPDPQPPSVGSSFASASASASAAASQSAATGSSRTSFTGPDMAEESAFDPPCESGCETNSDTEGDDDYEMGNPLVRFPVSYSSRSYADVTRSSSNGDDALEMLGGIGGMQRIVINLARREDIPDEWWAEAGLSRTLSREASSN